jgi:hypothetical protein
MPITNIKRTIIHELLLERMMSRVLQGVMPSPIIQQSYQCMAMYFLESYDRFIEEKRQNVGHL